MAHHTGMINQNPLKFIISPIYLGFYFEFLEYKQYYYFKMQPSHQYILREKQPYFQVKLPLYHENQ